MGMVVQHNLSAINANNKLNANVSGLKKSTEKLSSGYAINRAGDNAAGLAISEKMRSQIRGLTQATKNAQDGISLIQTAEGGLNETHSILQRMRELAVQSANGTYQDDTDREAIQLEVDALKSEIDRISTSTEYNNIKLLDGSQSKGTTSEITFAAGAAAGLALGTTVAASAKVSELAVSADAAIPDTVPVAAGDAITDITYSLTYKDNDTGATQTMTFDLGKISSAAAAYATGADAYNAITALASNTTDTNFTGLLDQLKNSSLGEDYTFAIDAGKITATARVAGANSFEMLSGELSYTVAGKTGVAKSGASTTTAGAAEMYTIGLNTAAGTDAAPAKFSIDGQNFEIVKLGNTVSEGYTALYTSDGKGKGAAAAIAAQLREHGINATNVKSTGAADTDNIYLAKTNLSSGNGGITFQIGANGTEDQRVTLNIDSMSSGALGVQGCNVSTRGAANAAIDDVDSAIKSVSMQRAGLGALQNRLEYTVNNLTTTNENLTAAESQIRDTDMATEMISYTKFNILQQASQAMLAQANQQPQAILQLLG